MFENEHDFRKLVNGLKIDAEPNPAHRERLRRQMLQTFEQERVSRGSPALPTSHFRLPTSYMAVAAVLLIAAAVGLWSFFGRGPMTFYQVRLATQKMPWLYAFVSRYQGSEVHTERHWYNFEAEKAYAVMDDGSVVSWEFGAGQRKLAYS